MELLFIKRNLIGAASAETSMLMTVKSSSGRVYSRGGSEVSLLQNMLEKVCEPVKMCVLYILFTIFFLLMLLWLFGDL